MIEDGQTKRIPLNKPESDIMGANAWHPHEPQPEPETREDRLERTLRKEVGDHAED